MSTWADKTKFAKLYSETYWGNYPLKHHDGNNDYPLLQICENRNNFAIEYNLKKSLKYIKKHSPIKNIFEYTLQEIERQGAYVDHTEYYDTGYSVVCVTSHWCPEEKEYIWNKHGFNKIPQIYSPEQTTFLMELFYGRKH